MRQLLQSAPEAREVAAGKTPLDVKLFYGFVSALGVLMAALLLFWQPEKPHPPGSSPATPLRELGSFSFTDQTGRTVSELAVAGRFAVVNFIHTSCSLSCLQVNQRMAEVQRLTADQDDVRLLSFTVDPRSDTPPVLAEFGRKFGSDPERWSMLTGPKAELYALIETSFLKRDLTLQQNSMPGGFADVDRIAVVDRAGRVRRFFDGMRAETPAAVVKFLAELRTETP